MRLEAKKEIKTQSRYKNPYFWIGLICVAFNAANIDFNSLTNWDLFLNAVISIKENPVAIASVIGATVGVFVNPTTKGLKDK